MPEKEHLMSYGAHMHLHAPICATCCRTGSSSKMASAFNRSAVPVCKKPPKADILIVFCQKEREEWGRSLRSLLTVQIMFPATSRQFCPNCIWALVSGDARVVEAKEAYLARAPSMWIWESHHHAGGDFALWLFGGHPCNPSPTLWRECNKLTGSPV